jgi:hypothetical protein
VTIKISSKLIENTGRIQGFPKVDIIKFGFIREEGRGVVPLSILAFKWCRGVHSQNVLLITLF